MQPQPDNEHAERARLLAVAEDGHRLALEQLIHEDADDVPIAVAEVLSFPAHVVRAHLGGDRFVDQVHRARHVVRVVEPPDEMAEPFGRVRGEMIHVVDVMVSEDPVEEGLVQDRSLIEHDR